MQIDFNDPCLYIQRIHPDAIIPTKRDEDSDYDLYAAFDADVMTIPPHTTVLVPTGITSAFSPKYRVKFEERGSNAKTHLIVRAGVIDSGYRGEWLAALYNDSDKFVVIGKSYDEIEETERAFHIPICKAVCQFAMQEVPKTKVVEIPNVDIYKSERGRGKLGASGK